MINRDDMLELTRRMTPARASIDRIAGAYFDEEGYVDGTFNTHFLKLSASERAKNLELAKTVLISKTNEQLREYRIPEEKRKPGSIWQLFDGIRETGLKDDAFPDLFYELLGEKYQPGYPYACFLFHGRYDVPVKGTDKAWQEGSEEVYEYLICAICPVDLSKPGLGFLEEEHRIGPRVRDWVVGAVDTAFLFPAFNDRSTDIHSTLFYTKNTKEPHSEFMANGLGCGIERTATEQKMAFHSIVRNVLGAEDEHTDDVLLDLQQNLSDMIDEYAETHDDDEDVFLLDKEVVTKLLADSEISEEKAAKIEKSVDEAFGEKPPAAENVIDSKALVQNELRVEKMALEDQVGTLTVQLNEKDEALAERTSQLIEKQEEIDNYIAETKTYDVVLRVKPEKASQIKSQVINGQKCLVIPMDEDEHATINGVNTTV